ncbi:hypothetical protein [Paucibacter soli]
MNDSRLSLCGCSLFSNLAHGVWLVLFLTIRFSVPLGWVVLLRLRQHG